MDIWVVFTFWLQQHFYDHSHEVFVWTHVFISLEYIHRSWICWVIATSVFNLEELKIWKTFSAVMYEGFGFSYPYLSIYLFYYRQIGVKWRRQWYPTPVLLPGKSHGWRSLVGCSPWGCYGRHDWETSLSLFTFTHWRRKWQPTPVFLPGESQGQGSLVGCHLWGRTGSDTTEVT